MFLRTFGGSLAVAAVGLVAGWLYGGTTGLALTAILAVLEVSLSFDNAVVNATVLVRMSPFWQRLFLTVGVAIAVFGMRLLFPLLIVGVTAKLNPAEAIRLALEKGDPDKPGTYGYLLQQAHPAIAAFGGMFLLMIFLDFMFETREITWLTWLERPLARIGKLDQLSVIIALGTLAVAAYTLGANADTATHNRTSTVLISGVLGLMTYLVVSGLDSFFEQEEGADEDLDATLERRKAMHVVGKQAFFLFLYLEVLDASFSFDGVVGAFAITSDPIIIAIGLGIGAMFIRSLTVFLVRKGTLSEYVYLEHGALWAIGALAVILLITIEYKVPEVVTGLIGVAFIGAALVSSIVRNRRLAAAEEHASADQAPAAV
ncbi:MAG TPA: DUF475 domain-containing protein [Jatrophihabitans sp.]|nr:DUF475 domain-containing protein [Jatrophihabitans sp.]